MLQSPNPWNTSRSHFTSICLLAALVLMQELANAQDALSAPKAFPPANVSTKKVEAKTSGSFPQPIPLPDVDPFTTPKLIEVEHKEATPPKTLQKDNFFAPITQAPRNTEQQTQSTFKPDIPPIDSSWDRSGDPFQTSPPQPQLKTSGPSVLDNGVLTPTANQSLPKPTPLDISEFQTTKVPVPQASSLPPLTNPNHDEDFQQTSNSNEFYSPKPGQLPDVSTSNNESVFGSFDQTPSQAQLPATTSHSLPIGNGKPATVDVHEVLPGENYWTISRKHYGAARYFAALAEYNKSRISRPDRMKPGMFVMVPNVEFLEQQYPEISWVNAGNNKPNEPAGFFIDESGQPAFRIGKGDTLTDIAQSHLGRMARWQEIYHLNQQALGSRGTLTIGMVLRLPADACQVTLAPPIGEVR